MTTDEFGGVALEEPPTDEFGGQLVTDEFGGIPVDEDPQESAPHASAPYDNAPLAGAVKGLNDQGAFDSISLGGLDDSQQARLAQPMNGDAITAAMAVPDWHRSMQRAQFVDETGDEKLADLFIQKAQLQHQFKEQLGAGQKALTGLFDQLDQTTDPEQQRQIQKQITELQKANSTAQINLGTFDTAPDDQNRSGTKAAPAEGDQVGELNEQIRARASDARAELEAQRQKVVDGAQAQMGDGVKLFLKSGDLRARLAKADPGDEEGEDPAGTLAQMGVLEHFRDAAAQVDAINGKLGKMGGVDRRRIDLERKGAALEAVLPGTALAMQTLGALAGQLSGAGQFLGAGGLGLDQAAADAKTFAGGSDDLTAQAERGGANALSLMGTGLVGGALRAASDAYGSTLQQTGDPEAAAREGVKSFAGLAAYLAAGGFAAKVASGILGENAPAYLKAFSGFAGAELANVGTSAVLRALEAKPGERLAAALPDVESLTADTLFAVMHGAGEYQNATPEARDRAEDVLQRRGFSDAQIEAPIKPSESGATPAQEIKLPAPAEGQPAPAPEAAPEAALSPEVQAARDTAAAKLEVASMPVTAALIRGHDLGGTPAFEAEAGDALANLQNAPEDSEAEPVTLQTVSPASEEADRSTADLAERQRLASVMHDHLTGLGHENPPPITVYSSGEAVPDEAGGAEVRQSIADGSRVEAFHTSDGDGNRELALLHDGAQAEADDRNMTIDQRAKMLAAHEITHDFGGLGILFPGEAGSAEYRSVVEGVLRRVPQEEQQKLASLYGWDVTDTSDRAKLAEEILARFNERQTAPPSWVQLAIGKLRTMLRRFVPLPAVQNIEILGGRIGSWADNDVRALLDTARRRRNAILNVAAPAAPQVSFAKRGLTPEELAVTVPVLEARAADQPTQGGRGLFEWLRDRFGGREFRNLYTNWRIGVSREGLTHTVIQFPEVTRPMLTHLDSVLENGVWLGRRLRPDFVETGKGVRWQHHFYTLLNVDGVPHVARALVNETLLGERFYDMKGSEVKKTPVTLRNEPEGGPEGRPGRLTAATGAEPTIAELAAIVKAAWPDDPVTLERPLNDRRDPPIIRFSLQHTENAHTREADDLYRQARSQAGLPAAEDIRPEFHVGTLIGRALQPWRNAMGQSDTVSPEALAHLTDPRSRQRLDAQVNRANREADNARAMWPEFKERLADVVASLPERQVRDARTGKVVDPFAGLKQAFPGGEAGDLGAAVTRAADLSQAVLGKSQRGYGENGQPIAGGHVLRDYLNVLEVLHGAGAGDYSRGIDELTRREGRTQTTADALAEAQLEHEGSAMLGEETKQEGTGFDVYRRNGPQVSFMKQPGEEAGGGAEEKAAGARTGESRSQIGGMEGVGNRYKVRDMAASAHKIQGGAFNGHVDVSPESSAQAWRLLTEWMDPAKSRSVADRLNWLTGNDIGAALAQSELLHYSLNLAATDGGKLFRTLLGSVNLLDTGRSGMSAAGAQLAARAQWDHPLLAAYTEVYKASDLSTAQVLGGKGGEKQGAEILDTLRRTLAGAHVSADDVLKALAGLKGKTGENLETTVKRLAATAAEAKRKRENEKYAAGLLDQYARIQSDTPDLRNNRRQNEVREAFKAQVEKPASPEDFRAKMTTLGVTDRTAGLLFAVAAREVQAREAARMAREAAEEAARPDRTANSILDSLASSQSDTQSWPESQKNLIREIVRNELRQEPIDAGRREPWTSALTAKLTAAGVSPALAEKLAGVVWREQTARTALRQAREMANAAEGGSLRPLVDQILNTPLSEQGAPDWINNAATEYFKNAGLSTEQAVYAAKAFARTFGGRLADAREMAARNVIERSTPWQARYEAASDVVRRKMLGDVDKIVQAVRAGVTDPSRSFSDELAASNGWRGFTEAQNKRMAELDKIISNPDTLLHEAVRAQNEILRIVAGAKMPPAWRNAIVDSYRNNLLSGVPTLALHLFQPMGIIVRDGMIEMGRAIFEPWRIPALVESLGKAFASYGPEFRWALKNDVYARDVEQRLSGVSELRRMLQQGARDLRSGDLTAKASALPKVLFGSTDYVRRVLGSLMEAGMTMRQEMARVLFAAEAIKRSGLGMSDLYRLMEAGAAVKERAYADGVDRGMSHLDARVHSLDALREALQNGLAEKVGSKEAGLVETAAGREGDIVGGRKLHDFAEPGRTDEGLISNWGPNQFMDAISTKMRGKDVNPVAKIASYLAFGILHTPYRILRAGASFSPYGIVRWAVHQNQRSRGVQTSWEQSMGTHYQERLMLAKGIAGTLLMGALGPLVKRSLDDDDGKPYVKITGAGPDSSNPLFREDWQRTHKPFSIEIGMHGYKVAFNYGKGLAEPFLLPLIAAGGYDDHLIRQQQGQAKMHPRPLEGYLDLAAEYLSSLQQRGAFVGLKNFGDIWSRVSEGKPSIAAGVITQSAANFLPWNRLAQNVTSLFDLRPDKSTVRGAIIANLPVLPAFASRPALNLLGDPVGDQSTAAKLWYAGSPVIFKIPHTDENDAVYGLFRNRPSPMQLNRAHVEEQYGPLEDDEWYDFVKDRGEMLKTTLEAKSAILELQSADRFHSEIDRLSRNAEDYAAKVNGMVPVPERRSGLHGRSKR